MTGKNKAPAHQEYNINVTQKQSLFNLFNFNSSSVYDCLLFLKRLLVKKNDKVKFDKISETNEEYLSVTYGSIRLNDSYQFLTMGIDELVKTLDIEDFDILEKKFQINGSI